MIDPTDPPIWTVVLSVVAKWYIYLGAGAGAVTGALMKTGLTFWGRVAALFIGFTTAMFVGPFLVGHFFPGLQADSKEAACLYWFVAVTANGAIPEIIKRVSQWMGDPLSILKPPK